MNRTALALAIALSAATLAACDRDDDALPLAPHEDAATVIPRSLVWDPSLPDASKVFAQADQAPKKDDNSGGQDTRANNPAGTLTKQEEKHEMPKSGQVNNYSSPAVEGGSPKH
jgi:hypothetical protein